MQPQRAPGGFDMAERIETNGMIYNDGKDGRYRSRSSESEVESNKLKVASGTHINT